LGTLMGAILETTNVVFLAERETFRIRHPDIESS
jgi:hypothetical protein